MSRMVPGSTVLRMTTVCFEDLRLRASPICSQIRRMKRKSIDNRPKPARVDVRRNNFADLLLDDRGVALVYQIYLRLDWVDPDHLVAVVCEAARRNGSSVANPKTLTFMLAFLSDLAKYAGSAEPVHCCVACLALVGYLLL